MGSGSVFHRFSPVCAMGYLSYNMPTMAEKVIESPAVSRAIEKKYANKWVAFSPDYKKVVASGDSLVGLDKKVGDKKVVFTKILPDVFFAPGTYLR